MSYTLAVIFSFSIVVPSLIGWIRFREINPAYYPFIYCLWIGLANEVISFLLIRNGHSNAVNNNIYVLTESLLITWLFFKLGLFQRQKFLFPLFLFLLISIWSAEALYIRSLHVRYIYFRISYSFLIAMMSVNMINRQLLTEKENILKNPIFLISVAFVLYYTYKIILLSFQIYGVSQIPLVVAILGIDSYLNLLSIIIFTLAVLWMPTKHRFSPSF